MNVFVLLSCCIEKEEKEEEGEERRGEARREEKREVMRNESWEVCKGFLFECLRSLW